MLSYIPHSKPTIDQNDLKAVEQLLNSGILAKGSRTSDFEEKISEHSNVAYSTCTTSGSAALQIILSALKLKAGCEIILPSYVCKSVMQSVLALGYKPVLCDVGHSWVMTHETILPKINDRTGAIILVHIFGIDAWSEDLCQLKVPLIEDFCQAFALHKQVNRALKGIAGFYSFNATKCLTTGEGGAIIANDNEFQYKVKAVLAEQKIPSLFSDYQAALGLSQLDRYNIFLEKRKIIAEQYKKGITNKLLIEKFNSVFQQSVLFRFLLSGSFNIDEVIAKAAKKNIALRRGVDKMLHNENDRKSFINTEATFNSTLSLPIYPSLSGSDQNRIIDFINSI